MSRAILILAAVAGTVVTCPPRPLGAQAAYQASEAEREAVRRAALDYLEGFYEGDTTKLVRSLSPTMVKYGYFVPRGQSSYGGEPMSYAEAIAYARGVKERNQPAPATAPKEVILFEVLDQTAAVKVVAWWGSDYLHLARVDGRWMIQHVMWQTAPRRP
jgi:hypothetical protein